MLIQGLERRLGVVSNEHQTEATQAKTSRLESDHNVARREGTISGLCQNTCKVTPLLEVSVAKQKPLRETPAFCANSLIWAHGFN